MARQTRKIGEAAISSIGYGAMGISTAYGSVPPDEERMKVHATRPIILRFFL